MALLDPHTPILEDDPGWSASRAVPRFRTIRRALVVDDCAAQRAVLVRMLRRWGISVVEAGSGEAALAELDRSSVDLVVSDWIMPGLTGPELCTEMRARGGDDYVYFILLTIRAETEFLSEGLDRGADDFVAKPVKCAELFGRMQAGDRIMAIQRELSKKNRLLSNTLTEVQRLNAAFDDDLEEARKLQESLIPERHHSYDPADVTLYMRPYGHVGGDLVGHFRVNDRHVGLFAIDVSGHGVASALMTARLAAYLTATNSEHNVALELDAEGRFRMRPPEVVCGQLNDMLLSQMDTGLYFTMALVDLNLETGVARIAQAGHPPPLVHRADGEVETIGTGGMPIGLIYGAEYQAFEVDLAAGDRLLLYSDGLTEATGPGGKMLEEQGLARLLRRHHRSVGPELFESLMWDLDSFTEHRGADDDISGVLVTIRGNTAD